MTTPSTAASAVAITATSLHGISQHFTGGVPRLPRSSLAADAHHRYRWLVLEIVEAGGCQPTEAGLGISPDGSARLEPQQQAAGQRERIACGLSVELAVSTLGGAVP